MPVNNLVRMKFAKDSYLRVVATSWDFNFDYPQRMKIIMVLKQKGEPFYNTSGILIHKLGQVWDEEQNLLKYNPRIDMKYQNLVENSIYIFISENE